MSKAPDDTIVSKFNNVKGIGIRRLSRMQASHFGRCSDLLRMKAKFASKRREYNIGNGVSSSDFQNNINDSLEELASFLTPDQLSRMTTNVEAAATNVGVFPPSYWQGETPFEDKTYMHILKYVARQVRKTIYNSLNDGNGKTLPVAFNLSSSVGVVKFGDELSNSKQSSDETQDFGCSHEARDKRIILDHFGARTFDELFAMDPNPIIIIGYRLQADSEAKRGLRPALIINKNGDIVETHVENSQQGYRVRPVAGYPWTWNLGLIALNQLIFDGLASTPLYEAWKFEHSDVLTKFKDLFIVCSDIGNNDQNFIPEENELIHQLILPPDVFKMWKHVQENGSIVGAYDDDNDETVYYEAEYAAAFKALMSGEGLTSIVNKIKHTVGQIYSHLMLRYYKESNNEASYSKINEMISKEEDISLSLNDEFLKEAKSFVNDVANGIDLVSYYTGVDPETSGPSIEETDKLEDELMLDIFTRLLNNGDDTLDGFKERVDQFIFKHIAVCNRYAVVGLESPGFSGISIELGTNFLVTAIYADMKSLFVKGIEKERRDIDSKLASLYYNSILGKIDFISRYPDHYGDDMIVAAIQLYFKLVGFEGDSLQLEELAALELEEAMLENDKQASIQKLIEQLGETDPTVINWKYSTKELMEAAEASGEPEIIDDIFIHRKVDQLVCESDLEYMNNLDYVNNHERINNISYVSQHEQVS